MTRPQHATKSDQQGLYQCYKMTSAKCRSDMHRIINYELDCKQSLSALGCPMRSCHWPNTQKFSRAEFHRENPSMKPHRMFPSLSTKKTDPSTKGCGIPTRCFQLSTCRHRVTQLYCTSRIFPATAIAQCARGRGKADCYSPRV